MVKIRLARIGAKKVPQYRIVVQDAAKPRDGARIDEIGFYDPNTNPSTIKLDLEKTQDWIKKGAQPTTVVNKLIKAAKKANQ